MKAKKLLERYIKDPEIGVISEILKPNEDLTYQIKGLKGSLDAVVAASVYSLSHQNHLFVLHDNEEAAYFHDDLQNLLGGKEVFFYPSSYKKPYQLDETENANILRRAEILNRINNRTVSGELIVTYPAALTEKVINKKALKDNTLPIRVNEALDSNFLREVLESYDFEITEFVYEAGQYAIRGGIIDVFSYANELPYRIELFGNEIESIRTFDPNTQLSINKLKQINLIPNIQSSLTDERRQSFIDFLPRNTKIWIKDRMQMMDVIEKYHKKAEDNFKEIMSKSGDTQIVSTPEELFETKESFSLATQAFAKIEFGHRFISKPDKVTEYQSKAQPSFKKNFELLGEALLKYQHNNFSNLIVAESAPQIDRLVRIFEEINPEISFETLHLGLREGFIDEQVNVNCYTDHQIFERFHRFKTRKTFTKSKALTLKELNTLSPGDYVTHIDHGVGRFAGLEKVEVNGNHQESIRIVYRDDDLLYVSIHSLHKISKFSGKEGAPPSISKLGSPEWENKKKRVKRNVQDIAEDLILLYAKRKTAPGFAFSNDTFMQVELESSFIYEDTPDQATASDDVKKDLEQPHPMDRLVCGDVGFGKTEVAIRAAFKVVTDSKQVAVLVPTTILAMQHFHTFSDRLKDFPVKVEYINRFKSTKEIKEILKEVEEGKVDIIIGTHRLVNKDVKFKNLGLMVIDEEQKFGVKVKERLKEMRVNIDALTLTATPIPRTLHFSLMGARDLSIISTAPPNRQPVTTELQVFNETVIRDSVSFELRRGGQVFFVHNRIQDIEEVANIILKLVPDASIGIAHGRMEGHKLENAMLRFIEGDYDVLVSTNIIESGLDIPNANTIIINHAHMFGLSDLHQMRGRVGRSNKKAFCYLLAPPTVGLTTEARKRLQALEEFSDLGDGFKVAMRDLDIRGAGNLLGAEQSGFISDLGFDAYHKILDEAVQELKESKFKELFEKELAETASILVQDCIIETDLEIIIPEEYISNITERLRIYSRIDNINTEEELESFCNELTDRFGEIPETVQALMKTIKLRWVAKTLGMEKLVLKGGKLRAFFVSAEKETFFKSEKFGQILKFAQENPNTCRLKEHKQKLTLIINPITAVEEALKILQSV